MFVMDDVRTRVRLPSAPFMIRVLSFMQVKTRESVTIEERKTVRIRQDSY